MRSTKPLLLGFALLLLTGCGDEYDPPEVADPADSIAPAPKQGPIPALDEADA